MLINQKYNFWRVLLILFILVAIAYWPTMGAWFRYDDFELLRYARDSHSFGNPISFVQQSHNSLFTPLSNILFYSEFILFGFTYSSYQAISLLVHLLNSFVVFGISFALEKKQTQAIIAGIFFATAYPVQEAVSWVAAFVHLFAALFYLISVLSAILWAQTNKTRYLILCLISMIFGALAKEDIVTLPAMLIFVLLLIPRQIPSKSVIKGIILICTIGLVYVSFLIWWHFSVPGSSVTGGFYEIGLHGIGNFRFLIGLLIPPPGYIPFFAFLERYVPRIVLDIYAILGWSILIPMAFWFIRALLKGTVLQKLAILLIVIAFAPFSMATVGISLRYLYISYAGFAILLADLLLSIITKSQRGRQIGTAFLVLFVIGNILVTWVWQFRMNQNSKALFEFVNVLTTAYNESANETSMICVNDLPEKFWDVEYAVPFFAKKSPRPIIILGDSQCNAENPIRYRYDGEMLIQE